MATAAAPDERLAEADLNTWLLGEILRGATQDEWLADFAKRAGEANQDRRTAAADVVGEAYREALIEAEAA